MLANPPFLLLVGIALLPPLYFPVLFLIFHAYFFSFCAMDKAGGSGGHGGGGTNTSTTGSYDIYGHYVPTRAESQLYDATHGPKKDSVLYGYYTLYFCGASLVAFALLRVLHYALLRSR